jgi:Tfp pilus assembly protein PilX
MKTPLGRLRDDSGSTLVVVMILAIIMLATVATVFEFGAQDASLAAHSTRRAQALYLAEAGLSQTYAWLEAQSDPPADSEEFFPIGEEPDSLATGSFTASVIPDDSNPGTSRKYYTIRSAATVGDKTRVLECDVMTQSYAQFIYFTEDEHLPGSTTPVWFCTQDALDGSIHTNGQLHLWGDPRFFGHVTSAFGGPDDPDPSHDPSFMFYNNDYYNHVESAAAGNPPHDEPVFGDGYELGTTEIELPDCLNDLRALAADGGLTITGNTEIQLSRSSGGSPMYGYLSYRPVGGSTWTDVSLASINGVVFITGQAQVKGVLDGSLTIGTSGDMYITDDVTYRASDANGPLPGCDDILGLVSERNVIISDNAANRSDCTIHAHVMALETSFTAQNYRSGSPRGTLTVHGGIIQKYRGGVGTGTIRNGQVVISTGYAKNYHYDPRFDLVQPPGYLLTGKYYKLAWREVTSEA